MSKLGEIPSKVIKHSGEGSILHVRQHPVRAHQLVDLVDERSHGSHQRLNRRGGAVALHRAATVVLQCVQNFEYLHQTVDLDIIMADHDLGEECAGY